MIKDRVKALIGRSAASAINEENHQVTDSDSSSNSTEDIHICAMAEDEDSNDEVSSTSISVSTSPTFEDMIHEFENIKKAHEFLKQENLQLQLSNLELKEENDLLKNNYENMSIDCDTSKIENEKLTMCNHQLAHDLNETKSHLESKTNDFVQLESRNKNLLKRHDELDNILKGFEKSSRKMEELLSSGQQANNRHGLGYPSSSNSSSHPAEINIPAQRQEIVIPRIPDPVGMPPAERTARAAIPPPRTYHIQRNRQPVRRPVRQNLQHHHQTYLHHQHPVKRENASNYQRQTQHQQWYSALRYRIQEPFYPTRRQKAAYHHHYQSYWKPKRQAYRSRNTTSFPQQPSSDLNHRYSHRNAPRPRHFMHNHHSHSDYVPASRRHRKNGTNISYSKPIAVRYIWVPKGTNIKGPQNQRVPTNV
ncbi:hypothetical protein OROMI_026999 [Orobanche minor]